MFAYVVEPFVRRFANRRFDVFNLPAEATPKLLSTCTDPPDIALINETLIVKKLMLFLKMHDKIFSRIVQACANLTTP